jgi:antitoxin ParD1/3/4
MTVTLTPEAEALVRRKVDAGPYQTAEEVIREALRALEERDRLNELRAKLQIGLDQLDRGERVPFTPEWRADRLQVAIQRATDGELPDPDVCP